MGSRISSPFDSYYQGKGSSGVTDTDLGKTKTSAEQDKLIKLLMQKRAKLDKMKNRGPRPA